MQKWQTVEEALLWLKQHGLRLDRQSTGVATVALKGRRILSALDFLRSQKMHYSLLEKGQATVYLTPADSQLLLGRSLTKSGGQPRQSPS